MAISRDDSGATDRWSGSSYARHSHHHRAADDWFLSKHHPAATDVVVDLGCGSGEFTAKLATLVPDGRVIGIDQSRSMVDAAQRWPAPNLQFLQAPVQTLDDLLEWQSVDLVVSRAMLHWVPFSDYPQLFAAVFHVLRPGCWFHSESAAPGKRPAPDSDAGRPGDGVPTAATTAVPRSRVGFRDARGRRFPDPS